MPHYAHAVIEHGSIKYQRGDLVPDDLPGLDELVEYGSVSSEPYVRTITVDAQGRPIGDAHVEAFAGDFTTEQIADPDVDTPSLGRPGDVAQLEHAAANADAGEASA